MKQSIITKEKFTDLCKIETARNNESKRRSFHKKAPDTEILVRRNSPLEVRNVRIYNEDSSGYSVCPACGVALDREYVNFCFYCGQRLSWKGFSRGEIEIELSKYLQESRQGK